MPFTFTVQGLLSEIKSLEDMLIKPYSKDDEIKRGVESRLSRCRKQLSSFLECSVMAREKSLRRLSDRLAKMGMNLTPDFLRNGFNRHTYIFCGEYCLTRVGVGYVRTCHSNAYTYRIHWLGSQKPKAAA